MGAVRIKLVHLWDKICCFTPPMVIIKQQLCLMRWAVYKKQIRQCKDLAKSPSIEPKVLVLMDFGIGNAVEATPLVQAIRMVWPKAKITIRPPLGGLFDNWRIVDHIADSPQALKGNSFTHTFVTWGGSIARNKGYCHLGQIHHTEEGMNLRCTKPEREYNMDMLKRLGYEGPTPPLYVSMRRPNSDIPSGRPRICLVPGRAAAHKFRHRQWPYFDQLGCSLLQQHHGAIICIIGTKNDQIPEALVASQGVVDLRSKLTLKETAWVLQEADLVIGNDCGPMHIANAVETPSIIIFGPTFEIKNGPVNKGIPLRHKVPCAPCQYDRRLLTCKNPICMNELKPHIVLKQVTEILETNKYKLKPRFPI